MTTNHNNKQSVKNLYIINNQWVFSSGNKKVDRILLTFKFTKKDNEKIAVHTFIPKYFYKNCCT